MHPALVLALFPATPFVAAAIGWVLARWAGRPAEFWRISLPVFVALVSALGIYSGWPPQLGYDLGGGIRIVYEIEPTGNGGQDDKSLEELAEALRLRFVRHVVVGTIVRPCGSAQVEVLTPRVTASQMEKIKKLVTTSGYLQFRILADEQQDEIICRHAQRQSQSESRIVIDDDGEPIAEWVKISTDESGGHRLGPEELAAHMTRTDPVTGEEEVLVLNDPFKVEGRHLSRAWAGYDHRMQPCLHCTFNSRGSVRFGALTGANLPRRDIDFYRKLGIIVDQRLISAPRIMSRISDRAQITGNFTVSEVELLAGILKSGRLPMRLKPMPVSENRFLRGERPHWAQWCLAATVAALLMISALLVFRFGWHGFAATVAIWLGAAALVAGLLAAGVRFTFPTVAAMCVVAVALAISLAFLCEVKGIRRTSPDNAGFSASPSRSWPLWAVVAFTPLLAVAAVIYVLGFGELRYLGQLLVLVSVSSAAGVVLCFWPLKGLFGPPSNSEDPETAAVIAEANEQDSG